MNDDQPAARVRRGRKPDTSKPIDAEFARLRDAVKAFTEMDDVERERALRFLADRFNIARGDH